jgi:putative resolvase
MVLQKNKNKVKIIMNISIGQAAEVIGVSISTLRRWEEEELYKPDFRTKGGHRRYDLSRIEREFLNKSSSEDKRKVVAYARVPSHDQKADLIRQEQRLERVCAENKYNFELISDLGSGINYNKKGLNKLIKMICNRQVSKLILTHKDRLLRFGSPLLFKLCKFFGSEIDILDTQICDNFEKILVADVIEVMTVFTARMHGKRSHKNKRLCAL